MCTFVPAGFIDKEKLIKEGYDSTAFVLPVKSSIEAMKRIALARKHKKAKFEKLDQQILAFADEPRNLQSQKTLDIKRKAFNKIFKSLKDVTMNEEMTLHFCGSTLNGCGVESCDVDLCWAFPVTPEVEGDKRYPIVQQGQSFDPRRLLAAAARQLEDDLSDSVVNLDVILNARVPIIKFDMEIDGLCLPVDININNLAGIYNTFLIYHYTKIDPRFSILSRVLKAWGKKAEVVKANIGYLNSYTIVLMVMHFLQCGVSPPILPNLNALYPELFDGTLELHKLEEAYNIDLDIKMEPNDTPIGDLLIGFLRYYGMFNYEYEGIYLRLGRVAEKPNGNDLFFLEEVYDRFTVPKNLNFQRLDYIKCTFLDVFAGLLRNTDFKAFMEDVRIFRKKV